MSSLPRSVLIGRQVARSTASDGETRHVLTVLLIGILLGALLLAALRVDLIRLRYGLADVMSEEKALLEQQRELTAQVERARGPGRLARLAREKGFVRPERLIELDAARAMPPR